MARYNLENEFINACGHGMLFCVEKLMDEGVDITCKDESAIYAVIKGHIDTCVEGQTFEVFTLLFETGKFTNLDRYLSQTFEIYGKCVDRDDNEGNGSQDNMREIALYLCKAGAKFTVECSLWDILDDKESLKLFLENSNLGEVIDIRTYIYSLEYSLSLSEFLELFSDRLNELSEKDFIKFLMQFQNTDYFEYFLEMIDISHLNQIMSEKIVLQNMNLDMYGLAFSNGYIPSLQDMKRILRSGAKGYTDKIFGMFTIDDTEVKDQLISYAASLGLSEFLVNLK